MKRILLLIFIMQFILSCQNQKDKTIGDTKQDFNIAQNENDFSSFLDKFKSDSVFQKSRIKFPFITEILGDINEKGEFKIDKTQIGQDQWEFITLYWDSSYVTRELNAYNQRIEIKKDTATIYYEGVDNGIDVMLIFNKIDDEWFLIKEIDLSD